MTQAAGYTLDIYCDNAKSEYCPYHLGAMPHSEFVSNEVNCRAIVYRQAKMGGWKLSRNGGPDYCPVCSKSKKENK